jgi:hypothetical protein
MLTMKSTKNHEGWRKRFGPLARLDSNQLKDLAASA